MEFEVPLRGCPSWIRPLGKGVRSKGHAADCPGVLQRKDFSKDTRHKLMEAFFYSLSKTDNQELYQHAVATTTVLSDLQRNAWYEEEGFPEITDLASLLELRAKWRSCRISRPEGFFSSEGPASPMMSRLVTSNF
eukprot:s2845_g9.t1